MVLKGMVVTKSVEKGTMTSYGNLLDYEQILDQRSGLPLTFKGSLAAVFKSTSWALCPKDSTISPNQFHQLRPSIEPREDI